MVQKEKPAPFSDLLREFFSEQPSNVDGQFNTSTLYYRDWLFRKVFSIFEFEGFKPEWEMDYYIEHQFLDGEIWLKTGHGKQPPPFDRGQLRRMERGSIIRENRARSAGEEGAGCGGCGTGLR